MTQWAGWECGIHAGPSGVEARSWEFFSLPNSAVEVLVHARRHGLVVLISNVFAYHLRVQEAVTANAAMSLVAGEDVRTPLGAFRVVFGIGHFNNQPSVPDVSQGWWQGALDFTGAKWGAGAPTKNRCFLSRAEARSPDPPHD